MEEIRAIIRLYRYCTLYGTLQYGRPANLILGMDKSFVFSAVSSLRFAISTAFLVENELIIPPSQSTQQ